MRFSKRTSFGWAPWLVWRMDESYELEGDVFMPELDRLPSEYFKRQCYISVEPDEHPAVHMMKDFGSRPPRLLDGLSARRLGKLPEARRRASSSFRSPMPTSVRSSGTTARASTALRRRSPASLSVTTIDAERLAGRVAMYNGNVLKLGVFSSNCSQGRISTTVPESWSGDWSDALQLARLMDERGIDFMLPVARWKGYGGEPDHMGSTSRSRLPGPRDYWRAPSASRCLQPCTFRCFTP